MTSLVDNLGTLATRIATECKDIRTLLNNNASDLSTLATTAQTDLVSAVNEVVGRLVSSTDQLSEGTSNLFFTTARARGAISATGGIAYNASTGAISSAFTSGSNIAITGSSIAVAAAPTFTGTVTAPTFSGALSGNATTASGLAAARTIAITGGVTGSTSFDGTGNVSIAATVPDASIALGKLASIATATVLGNVSGSTGAPAPLAATDLRTLLSISNVENKSAATILSGLSSSNVTTALGFTPQAAGNYATIDGTGSLTLTGNATATSFIGGLTGNASTATKLATARSISLTGDVTWTGSFDGSAALTAAATIANGAVSNAKLATMATATFKGNVSGSTAAPSDLTVAQTKSALSLDLVENKSSATILGGLSSSNVTTALGFTPLSTAGGTISGALNVSTAGNLTVAGTAVTTEAPTDGKIYSRSSSNWTPIPIEIAVSAIGTPTASQVLARYVSGYTINASQAASRGSARVAPSASYTVTVMRNGASMGTFVVATSGTVTVTLSSTTIVPGDVITFVCPSSADSTLADLALTLAGTR